MRDFVNHVYFTAALRSQQRKRPVPPNINTPVSSRSQNNGSGSSGIQSAPSNYTPVSSRSNHNGSSGVQGGPMPLSSRSHHNGSTSSGMQSGPVQFTMMTSDYKTPRSSDGKNKEELSELKNVNLVWSTTFIRLFGETCSCFFSQSIRNKFNRRISSEMGMIIHETIIPEKPMYLDVNNYKAFNID